MIRWKWQQQTGISSCQGKLKDYYQLMKFTLSFTVVFSSVVSYLLAPNDIF